MKVSITKCKGLYYILGILSIVIIWFISSKVVNNSGILPGIKEVGEELISLLKKGNTYLMISSTILKILFALFISFVLAVLLGAVSLINYRIESFIRPYISFIRTVPVVSIAMFVLVIFFMQDIRYMGTIVIATLVVTPIIYEGIMVGFKTIDKGIIDSTKIISNLNFKVFYHVYLPLALPNIIASLLQSFGMGLKVLVMSEVMLNPKNTIGVAIGEYAHYGEMDHVFAWSIILIVIVLIFDYLMKMVKLKSWE